MKKIIAAILCLIIMFSLVGCVGETTQTAVPATEESTDTTTELPKNETKSSGVEWKQFLKEYSKWADEYVEFIKKYKENPTDLSLLGKYAGMISDVAEWTEKANNMSESLSDASPSEMAEYTAELLKITKKLAEVAN